MFYWHSLAILFLRRFAWQETRKTGHYFRNFLLLPLILIFFPTIFRDGILYLQQNHNRQCSTGTHFIYICGGKASAALHLCPRERWGKLMRWGKYLWWNNCGWWWMSGDRAVNDANGTSRNFIVHRNGPCWKYILALSLLKIYKRQYARLSTIVRNDHNWWVVWLE